MVTPFTIVQHLFHAQSLIGMVSLLLPMDSKYNELRQELFDASVKLCKCSDLYHEINDK